MKSEIPTSEKWNRMQKSTWNSVIKTTFAETLTEKGFGQTFNMIEEAKLLNFER